MNTRRTTLIIAIVLAVGTGWLLLTYLGNMQRSSAINNAPVNVIVAAVNIPPRVTITPNMIARVQRPASAVDPDALSDPGKVVGALSLITIPAGSAITSSKIGHPSDVGLPVRLTPGMRAVSIAINKVSGVSGLIEPGDRVDVIAIPPKSTAVPPPASTILRGIRVLAVGDSLEYSSATPSPQEESSTTITLEVTPKQADLLAMADLNTTLRLALRSPREPINSEPTEALHFPTASGSAPALAAASGPITAAAEFATALRGFGARPQNGATAAAGAAVPRSPVTIIDGTHYASESAAASP